jgi:hypothetical protein
MLKHLRYRKYILIALFALVKAPTVSAQSCGVTSSDVVAEFEYDCKINTTLQDGKVPESCKMLNDGITAANDYAKKHHLKPGTKHTQEVIAKANVPQYLAYVSSVSTLTDPWSKAVSEAVKDALRTAPRLARGTAELSEVLLNEAFARNPSFASATETEQRELLKAIMIEKDVTASASMKTASIKVVLSKVQAVDRQLQKVVQGKGLLRWLSIMVKRTPALKSGLSLAQRNAALASRMKTLGKLLGTGAKVIPVVLMAEAIGDLLDLGEKNCGDKQSRLTNYFPLDKACHPTFAIPEAQRYSIVGVAGAKPDDFQRQLNYPTNHPHPPNELCQQYTRFVAHRRAMESNQPAKLEEIDFKCSANGDVASFSFADGKEDAGMSSVSYSRRFEAIKTSGGNFNLSQPCATDVNMRNWRATHYEMGRGTAIIGPHSLDISGYAKCMGGAKMAPEIPYEALNTAFGVFQITCNNAFGFPPQSNGASATSPR